MTFVTINLPFFLTVGALVPSNVWGFATFPPSCELDDVVDWLCVGTAILDGTGTFGACAVFDPAVATAGVSCKSEKRPFFSFTKCSGGAWIFTTGMAPTIPISCSWGCCTVCIG